MKYAVSEKAQTGPETLPEVERINPLHALRIIKVAKANQQQKVCQRQFAFYLRAAGLASRLLRLVLEDCRQDNQKHQARSIPAPTGYPRPKKTDCTRFCGA